MKNDFQYGILYTDPGLFFQLNGNARMKFTPEAARGFCAIAARHGFYVGRVEGGFFTAPAFQHRLDCIWDSIPDAPMSLGEAESSNELAEKFITAQSPSHNAFIITAMLFE